MKFTFAKRSAVCSVLDCVDSRFEPSTPEYGAANGDENASSSSEIWEMGEGEGVSESHTVQICYYGSASAVR
jgi:hypothetical protein